MNNKALTESGKVMGIVIGAVLVLCFWCYLVSYLMSTVLNQGIIITCIIGLSPIILIIWYIYYKDYINEQIKK